MNSKAIDNITSLLHDYYIAIENLEWIPWLAADNRGHIPYSAYQGCCTSSFLSTG